MCIVGTFEAIMYFRKFGGRIFTSLRANWYKLTLATTKQLFSWCTCPSKRQECSGRIARQSRHWRGSHFQSCAVPDRFLPHSLNLIIHELDVLSIFSVKAHQEEVSVFSSPKTPKWNMGVAKKKMIRSCDTSDRSHGKKFTWSLQIRDSLWMTANSCCLASSFTLLFSRQQLRLLFLTIHVLKLFTVNQLLFSHHFLSSVALFVSHRTETERFFETLKMGYSCMLFFMKHVKFYRQLSSWVCGNINITETKR